MEHYRLALLQAKELLELAVRVGGFEKAEKENLRMAAGVCERLSDKSIREEVTTPSIKLREFLNDKRNTEF